ncbi:hypothetical protein BDN67DRAFT_332193 [Paxillus ammoniavirescens]|nr:hypothetical protein BDN67DRAFT_332193 [Paxillus ammoniavirescens]
MTNGGSAPNAQAVTQLAHSPPKEQLSQVYNDAHTVNQPQPSKPGEIPTLSTNPSNGRTPELVDDMVSNLTEKLQQALRHIKVLETHQTKLYEDNCQLVAAVSMLNERLLFSGASHSTQVLHFAEVQGKLRTSEANRAKLSGNYRALGMHTCSSIGSIAS